MSIRVVVAEDNYLMREGIREVLEHEEDVELVAVAVDYTTTANAIERDKPEVLVTDIRMPPTQTDEGIRIAEQLRETHPEMGVVVLSQYVDPHFALRVFEHGSARRAYLLKEHVGHPRELVDAIREVARGGSRVDPAVVETLVRERSAAERSPLAQLTAREREVLGEVAQGKSNAAIAASLFLTKRGIEKHINSIFAKLGLTDEEDVSRRVTATLMLLADKPGLRD
ncbi:MAG TPA: response regulator transcription factor [Gaiellaceae bacterium]|nr:response regulator transcription factor [Gaiellaceae bacterium]